MGTSNTDQSNPSARDTAQPDAKNRTPNTDMQAEDAGTEESGNAGKENPPQGAMKQTSKTPSERSGNES